MVNSLVHDDVERAASEILIMELVPKRISLCFLACLCLHCTWRGILDSFHITENIRNMLLAWLCLHFSWIEILINCFYNTEIIGNVLHLFCSSTLIRSNSLRENVTRRIHDELVRHTTSERAAVHVSLNSCEKL